MNKPYAWVSLPENEIQILPFPDDGKTLVAGDGFYLYKNLVKEQKMIDVLMELSKYRLLSKDEIEELAILRKAQEK